MKAQQNLRAGTARMTRGASMAALGFALMTTVPAFAQDAAEEDAIVVTGFRASLESAVNEKKKSEQIVESVSAEDIGKLPDASIGESIARLPGLTAQRLNGRAANISIRGFGPDLSTTLLNGREQTSTGDNRAVEFDQYPSEMVSQVNVYKTPSANIIGQGLVGTVDIRTARPLETGKRVLAVGVKGSIADLGKLNSGSRDKGYRANATYIDQFGDDTVGIALSASYANEGYQIEEYNAWGFRDFGPARLITGNKSFVTSTELKRLGLAGTLQADLDESVRMTVDLFYSKFDDDIIKRGIELPLGDALGWTAADVAPAGRVLNGNTLVGGTFTNIEAVVNNHVLERNADLFSVGYNIAWQATDKLKVNLDYGRSQTDRNELTFESNSGTGRGQGVGARDSIAFSLSPRGGTFTPTLNYSDPNLIQLTSPMGWGGIAGGQDGYYNNRLVEDTLDQYRMDLEYEIGGFVSAVRAGVALTDRSKSLDADESFVVLASGAAQQRVPDQFLLQPTQLEFLGLGPVISYDPRALLEGGLYRLVPNNVRDVVFKRYTIGEKLLTGYVQAALNGELGANTLTGNVGVQVVKTKQSSTGGTVFGGVVGATKASDKYTHVLPSLNLSLRTPSDFVFRVGLAREIQRPKLNDMRVSIDYGVENPGSTNAIIRGSGGNPSLRPYEADAIDFTAEKYFGTKGVVALQLFYKDIKNYIYEREAPFDYTGFSLGAVPVPIQNGRNGTLRSQQNSKGGSIYGAELAATLPFDVITTALDGFGLTGGLSYTKSKVRSNDSLAGGVGDIPGYSRWVANATAYFEKWGFNTRASMRYRSSFRGDLVGFGGDRTTRRALGEMIFDAQIGYDFQQGSALEGLSLFVQGQNLTDERFSTTNPGRPLEVIDYQIYGRRFIAGASYKF